MGNRTIITLTGMSPIGFQDGKNYMCSSLIWNCTIKNAFTKSRHIFVYLAHSVHKMSIELHYF